MTPEIEILRANENELQPLFEDIGFKLLEDFDWDELKKLAGGHLTERDRQDPDIMSNVEAMEKTNAMISWFGRDYDGFVGLWRGPSQTPLEMAPVVRLNTEGQYELRGPSVANYLAVENYLANDADADFFDWAREVLASLELSVRESSEAVWECLKGVTAPKAVHHTFYNEGRVKRGLAPIS